MLRYACIYCSCRGGASYNIISLDYAKTPGGEVLKHQVRCDLVLVAVPAEVHLFRWSHRASSCLTRIDACEDLLT